MKRDANAALLFVRRGSRGHLSEFYFQRVFKMTRQAFDGIFIFTKSPTANIAGNTTDI